MADVFTYIGAIFGGLFILFALLGGLSAPQEGALAAIGIGIAAVPYFISATLHRAEMRRRTTP